MSKQKNEKNVKRLKVKDAASMLWNTACKSEFGEVVKTSAQIKASAGVDTQTEQSQMAYTGKPLYLSYTLCAITDSSYLVHFLLLTLFLDNGAIFNRIISHEF